MTMLRVITCVFLAALYSTANAASVRCTVDAQALSDEFREAWSRLGRDEGYLGCPLSLPVATQDGQGTEVPFKDGLVQFRPSSVPKVLILAFRGARILVLADTFPADPSVAVATDAKDSTRQFSSETIVANQPAYIGVPYEHAADYRITFESCAVRNFGLCASPVKTLDPGVELPFSPYQIDLTDNIVNAELSTEEIFAEKARRVVRFEACREDMGALVGENDVIALLAKLHEPVGTCPFRSEAPFVEAANALLAAQFNAWIGTQEDPVDVPVLGRFCGRPGDYDAALWGLVRAAYKLKDLLGQSPGVISPESKALGVRAFQHLVKDLLLPHGGMAMGAWTVLPDDCGIRVPETENHILLIESSRFLINQLLQSEGLTPSPAYDNATNGNVAWLERHLQLFLMRDFYETNSIPYQRYSAYALLNLFDLSRDASIRDGSKLVLDYLSAKFAVESNELRRLVPFRRRLESDILDPVEFFGATVDAPASRMMLLARMSDRVDDRSDTKQVAANRTLLRYGHAHLASAGSLLITAVSAYRLPPAIRQRVMTPPSDTELQTFNLYEPTRDPAHLAFANEGVQISFSTPQFQLTAGGLPHSYGRAKEDLALEWEVVNGFNWQLSSPVAYAMLHPSIVSKVDSTSQQNDGGVRPTSLIPTLGGRRPRELIRFLGADERELRRNTCIAPNFICGLNLSLPANLVRAGKCPAIQLPSKIQGLWSSNGGAGGPMGCPINLLDASGDATVLFERGVARLWTWSTGKQAAMAAWVEHDGKDAKRDRIGVRFLDGPPVFQWWIRPYKNDAEFVERLPTGEQLDTLAHTWSGGNLSLDPTGTSPGSGIWGFELIGCQPYETIQYDRTAPSACKFWSSRINVRYEPTPEVQVAEPPVACDSALPEMPSGTSVLVLDVNGECDRSRYGFFVAVVAQLCERSPCSAAGSLYGLIEAVPAENYASFAAYQADFRARNGTRDYAMFRQNHHQLPSGDMIDFRFVPTADTTWAIEASSNATLDTLAKTAIDQWPRAAGPFAENDGRGRVKIKNKAFGQTLELDWTNMSSPKSNCVTSAAQPCP